MKLAKCWLNAIEEAHPGQLLFDNINICLSKLLGVETLTIDFWKNMTYPNLRVHKTWISNVLSDHCAQAICFPVSTAR